MSDRGEPPGPGLSEERCMTRTTPTNDAATRRRGDAEYLRTRLRRTRLRRMRLRGLLRLPRPYRARCRREPAEVELLRKGKVPMVDEQIGELTAEAVASGRLRMADDAVHAGTHRPEVEPDGATSITRAWREPGKLRRRSNEGTAPQYSAWSSRDPARPLSTGSVDTGSAAQLRQSALVLQSAPLAQSITKPGAGGQVRPAPRARCTRAAGG